MSSCRLGKVCKIEIIFSYCYKCYRLRFDFDIFDLIIFLENIKTCVEDEESRVGWIDHCADVVVVAALSADLGMGRLNVDQFCHFCAKIRNVALHDFWLHV